MSKIEEVRTAMYAAMKAKDKERKDALSMLLGALKAKAIDKREDWKVHCVLYKENVFDSTCGDIIQ